MFKEIFSFELKYRLKRPATWAYFGILFLFGLLVAIGDNGPSSEKVFVNAPSALATIMTTLSIFGIMIASAVMGVPVYRDIDHKTDNYFFSFPITEKGYLLGRFFGSLSILFLISLGLHLGLILGSLIGPHAGYVEPERYTALNLWHYLQPTLTIYWVNLLFTGCIFFALVSLTKRVMLAYAGGAILFITYLVSLTLSQDLENRELTSLLDPFALTAVNNTIQYWTPEEQNTLMIPFEGQLLYNRLLWLGAGILIMLYTVFRFDFQRFLRKKLGRKKKGSESNAINTAALKTPLPRVAQVFTTGFNFKTLLKLTGVEFKNILSDNFFKAILVAAVAFLFFDGWFGAPIYGTPSLPMTYYMLEVKDFTYIILVFVLIVFMTGEVMHRERTVNYNQIFGTLPIPNGVVYGAKFLALVVLCFFLVNMVLFSGVLNQVLKGYTNFEFGKYFYDLYLFEFPKYVCYVMLAFCVHSIITRKFLGHVVAIAIWVFIFGLNALGDIDNNMFLYSYSPSYTISDMNGFGHFTSALLWFRSYWIALGVVLTLIGFLFWKRGTDSGRKARFQVARKRLKPMATAGILVALMWFGISGYTIYDSTVNINKYRTSDEGTEAQAEYEKQLSQYDKIDQPKVTDVKLFADLMPEERSATLKGVFTMTNKTDNPIKSLHLNWGGEGLLKKEVTEFTIEGKEPALDKEYKDFGYQIYNFEQPLQPGDTIEMVLAFNAFYKGFPNEGSGSSIVDNGTFMNNGVFPSMGYSSQGELSSDKDRKKYGLPKKDYTLPDQNDKWGLSNLLFSDDGDYIIFEGTVSTAPDQIAILPGLLQKEWEENGRKYYQYKMTGELDFFFNISSARYDVHRDVWNGSNGEEVNIEIYHHPGHKYNLDRFVDGVKKSLDYFSENYSPYQYKQMRILEFPRYSTFAQSFPNTVPYAESFGWVGDFSDPNDLDYLFTVTSHEVAHQWWGHQITPSATRGANQISESMAEYSSLMVMKKEYGVDAMQKFLREELDRYLGGRANESKFEKTLLDNDTQSYVWYRKGGLILYALQDLIGEDQLNEQFGAYMKEAQFRPEAPFTTTHEWYDYMKKATPDSLQYYLKDSFEKITLYSNKTEEATYRKLDNGKYEVTLKVQSEKNHYDGLGKLLDSPTRENLLDIGIFAQDTVNTKGMSTKNPLLLKKVWVKPGATTFTFTVDKQPLKAGIDPYNKMIDRIPEDNLVDLEEQE